MRIKDKLTRACISAQTEAHYLKKDAKDFLTGKKKGAFAFEYIIVLVIMVAVIFAAWKVLGQLVVNKINDISEVMSNNGINPSGEAPTMPNPIK